MLPRARRYSVTVLTVCGDERVLPRDPTLPRVGTDCAVVIACSRQTQRYRVTVLTVCRGECVLRTDPTLPIYMKGRPRGVSLELFEDFK